MRSNADTITTKQMIFIIIGATIGVGILTLPEGVGSVAKQDSWMSVIIGGLLPLLGLFAMNLICGRFPDLTLAEYSEKVLGKWPGKLLSLFFVAYAVAYAAIVARIFIQILKIYLFPKTPLWALAGLEISIAAYLASKDVRVMGRVCELLYYESLVLFIFIFASLTRVEITFFQPVGQAGMLKILEGAYKTVFAYLGIEVLLVFYPLVQKKKEIVKAGMTAVAIVGLTYLSLAAIAMGVFGPAVIAKVRFALMVLLKTYTAPVIERAEFFFIIFYVFVSFRPVAVLYLAGRYTAEKMIGVKAPGLTTLVLFPIVLIISLVPENFEQTVSFSSNLGYAGIAFLTVIPLTLWLIASIRGIGGEKGHD